MTRLQRLGIGLAGAWLLAAASGPALAVDACAVPPELLASEATLPKLGKRVIERAPLKVVFVGTSYSAVPEADKSRSSYVGPLRNELVRHFPSNPVTVVDKSVPRQTAVQMADRFERDVLPEKPHLVIWQTGTTDAVRQVDPADFTRVLMHGHKLLRKAGIELVLMSMQYARGTANLIRFEPYNDALDTVADMKGVVLFHRHEIMRHWVSTGQFEFDDVPPAEREALMERAHGCVASLMSRVIRTAAR
ncbi:MAG: hypothetical protein FJX35_15490 [Alphaproteobacteria bacterium]|nr:hypothetical protein [Alphaproteobacteria bacterium]